MIARTLGGHAPSSEDWTTQKYDAFGVELYSVHSCVKENLGSVDVAYVKNVRAMARLSEVAGRTLIHFSLDPVTWFAGVVALWGHHQLETIEIGHSALHGAWDSLEDAKEFRSSRFRWDTPSDEEAWKKEHNLLHHQYTNVVGRDPDLNYGLLRVTDDTSWRPGLRRPERQPLDIKVTPKLPEGGTSEYAAVPLATNRRFSPGRKWKGTFTRSSGNGLFSMFIQVEAIFERDPTEEVTDLRRSARRAARCAGRSATSAVTRARTRRPRRSRRSGATTATSSSST